MNLLIITQKVDENDDLLGFFVGWIREFSKHFDKVNVITLGKGDYNLPDNVFVYSLGKESKQNKIFWFFKFYFYLLKLSPRSTSIFCHMSPIFALAAWPFSFIFQKKLVLWYLHRSTTLRLKLVEKLCYKIVTASKESLSIKSDKVIELGHGIDIDKFYPNKRENDGKLKIINVNRISKIKNIETLVKAISILKKSGLNIYTEIIGKPIMRTDFEYEKYLNTLIVDLNLLDTIKMAGFVPYKDINLVYNKFDVSVNLAPRGGLDKVALEAMACGLPCFTSNDAFGKYLGNYSDIFLFKHDDPQSLADKISRFERLVDRAEIGSVVAELVKRDHSLKNLIIKLSAVLS